MYKEKALFELLNITISAHNNLESLNITRGVCGRIIIIVSFVFNYCWKKKYF